jgi:hypothetical protein
VANETRLFQKPQTVAGNDSLNQVLSLLKVVCEELLEQHDWQCITREQIFTTNGSGAYSISSIISGGDFERVKDNTEWDRSNEKKIKIVSADQWQYLKSGIITNTGIYRFARIRNDDLIITPDASGDTLVLEYISRFYVKDNAGAAKQEFTDDTDTSFFKESLLKLGLKYYLKTEKGLPAEVDADRYYTALNNLVSAEKPMPIIGKNLRKDNKFVVNIPDSGAGL